MPKHIEKDKAINLRKKGFTYSEILKQVPVAKSTLSLWLRDVGLASAQRHRISKKRKEAQIKGAMVRRQQRIDLTEKIHKRAELEVGKLSKREIWLICTALYWAEGVKEKEGGNSSPVDFINSDIDMIRLFIRWLINECSIKRNDIVLRIYIHENKMDKIYDVKKTWSKCTGFPVTCFKYVYFKKHNPKTKRKNTGNNYIGALRITVKKSSSFNREIAGWTKGIHRNIL
ncbi:hypothetical protein ACFL6I_21600 [candidate division KSB1 bacterium]